MIAAATEIRDLLLPGLMDVRGRYTEFPAGWEAWFAEKALVVPTVSLPAAIAMGAAAAVINNPTVSRRGLFGLGSSSPRFDHSPGLG